MCTVCLWGTISPCPSVSLSSLPPNVIIMTLLFPLVRSLSVISSSCIFLKWCSRNSATLFQMRRWHPNKLWYLLLSFFIGALNGQFFSVTLSSQTVKSIGRSETLLSLLDPGSATISIVPALSLQEVGRLVLTAWQRNRCTYCYGSVVSDGSPYRRTGRPILTAWQHNWRPVSIYFCSFSLYFIFLMIIFDDPFVPTVCIVYFLSFFVL